MLYVQSARPDAREKGIPSIHVFKRHVKQNLPGSHRWRTPRRVEVSSRKIWRTRLWLSGSPALSRCWA